MRSAEVRAKQQSTAEGEHAPSLEPSLDVELEAEESPSLDETPSVDQTGLG